MQTFTDTSGRKWNLALNLGTAKRVFDRLGVNLLNPASKTDDGSLVSQRLLYDDLFLANVVSEIVLGNMRDDDSTIVEFFETLDGETMRRIDSAFWTEYRFFFAERGKDWAAKAIEIDLTTREQNAKAARDALSTSETSSNLPDEPESQISNV